MSRADLARLFGEPIEQAQEEHTVGGCIVLRLRTNLRYRGKILWVLWCRGHKRLTTDPGVIFRDKSWDELASFSRTFRTIDLIDDGRMAAWIKGLAHDARLGLIRRPEILT